ncbi:MAG: purine-binding chemotaxis protein CheW [Bacteroidetes bacterium]|nr:MAG: purine-binding chemotaxis protein CheW [Bacteroidota bacterium]
MENLRELLLFHCDSQRYAVQLKNVQKVISIVNITHLPEAPHFIRGIINVQGRFVPVADIRLRIGINEKNIELSDQIILINTPNRLIGLLVDETEGIERISEDEIMDSTSVIPTLKHIKGISKLKDDIIYISDVDDFLSFEEEIMLNKALEKLS